MDAIAAQFKNGNRNKKAIRNSLDSLEYFSIILHYQTHGSDRWQSTPQQQAS